MVAGWEVTVLAEDAGEPLPARVLGASVVAWDSVPQAAVGPDPQALAVVGDPRDFDERMSRWVTDYLHGGKETTLWGDNAWPGPHPHTEPVRFCPSRTALLFKAHALDRTGRSPSAVPGIEYFRVTGAAVGGLAHLRSQALPAP